MKGNTQENILLLYLHLSVSILLSLHSWDEPNLVRMDYRLYIFIYTYLAILELLTFSFAFLSIECFQSRWNLKSMFMSKNKLNHTVLA